MSIKASPSSRAVRPTTLTGARVEKISAVEGLTLSPRMRALLEMSKDKSGDERRQLIRAQFTPKSA